MAMNNSYFGFPPSGYASPYSSPPTGIRTTSTPTGIRTQRPRFGYSGPSLYPRPRSSASKPNPDSFSDSMINNYGTSTSRIDTSFNSENGNSYNNSYNTSGSNYYSANESFSHNPSYGEASMHSQMNFRSDTSLLRDNSAIYNDSSMMHGPPGVRPLPYTDMQDTGILPKSTPQYNAPNYNSAFGKNNIAEFKGDFQKNSTFGDKNNKPPFTRKFGKAKRMATAPKPQSTWRCELCNLDFNSQIPYDMHHRGARHAKKLKAKAAFPVVQSQPQSAWRCELCSLDFTSQIPYDMHQRGAKHAKKLKAKEALTAVQSQGTNLPIQGLDGETGFFCELCNVRANSSLQLQTHLEGSKHKSKLQPKESKDGEKESIKLETDSSVNGKTNGSLVRTLPPDFGEPQPSKLAKFACDVCCIAVNSEIQLQQHLSSKKHQNKVEGKPVVKGKKNRMENKKTASETETETGVTTETTEMEQVSCEVSTKVVGVKTLASSFVLGETLQ